MNKKTLNFNPSEDIEMVEYSISVTNLETVYGTTGVRHVVPDLEALGKLLREKAKECRVIKINIVYNLIDSARKSDSPLKPNITGKVLDSKETVYTFYVAESITNLKTALRRCEKQYKLPAEYIYTENNSLNNLKNPAIITNVDTHESRYRIMGRQQHSETTATVHVLQPDTDIVIDKNLRQIFPKKTGEMPDILKSLFGNPNEPKR